jgi:ribonuclease Z
MQAMAYDADWPPRDFSTSKITKVLMLGTGNPVPYPHRNGSSIAVIVNEIPYIFDAGDGAFGATGEEMPYFGKSRVKGFTMANSQATHVFITHLHSDHTMGLPGLLLGPWSLGRTKPMHVHGPQGTQELVDGLLMAYRHDIDYRVYSPTQKNDTGWRAQAHEISAEGKVFEDENVKVYAFKACHGMWPFPISYRIETPDRVIAISGDTTADCDGIRQAGKNADLLFIEGLTFAPPAKSKIIWPGRKKIPTAEQKKLMHSSTKEIVELANEVKPKHLITYHEQNYTGIPNQIEKEIREFGWKGKYTSSRDGDIF